MFSYVLLSQAVESAIYLETPSLALRGNRGLYGMRAGGVFLSVPPETPQ